MRLAITGGVGCGKSTIVGYCKEAGLAVASADETARRVFDTTSVQERIAESLQLPLPIDRAALRSLISESPVARHELDRLLHPLIWAEMSASGALVWEVPLLFEACAQRRFDLVWNVACSESNQLQRVSSRLGSESAARQLIGTQLTSRVRRVLSHRTIRTDAPETEVRAEVLRALSQIRWNP